MKYLIAGLGNIGAEYALTRHNIGFMVLDEIASQKALDFKLERHAFHTELKYKSNTIHFIKPSTYMNLSGKAIRYWLGQEKIPLKNLLVITDDISLPFAKNRIKASGSHGGHNGLRNIQELLDTKDFNRLRIGVGDNFRRGGQVDYVLSPFEKVESEKLPEVIQSAIDISFSFIDIGVERTMNFFN